MATFSNPLSEPPFVFRVVQLKWSWTGQPKYTNIHVGAFHYPEPMYAEASKWRAAGHQVFTYEPEVFFDDREPFEDTSIDFDGDDDTLFDDWGEALPF